MTEISVLFLGFMCVCTPRVCVCIFAIAYRMPDVHTQSNAYFMHFAIEWKYEITHSVRIDN